MQEYVIADARDVLKEQITEGTEARVVHFDDAWARPKRDDEYGNDPLGVKYPTHDFEMTKTLLDLIYDVLADGGWLIMDCDAWLLPRTINYIRETWGDVTEPPAYSGGGYRKTGRVVYTKDDGTVDRGDPARYLRQSGYPVVFAHKGETKRACYESAVQLCSRQREQYGWGSVKPLSPYETWIEGLVEEGELVIEPCAGTAPACLAAEKCFGDDVNWLACDIERDAYEAYTERRSETIMDMSAIKS